MSEYIQVLTTVDSREKAEEIAGKLLNARLAACIQIIGPIKSMYWWKGVIEYSQEWICLVKTKAEMYNEVESMIKNSHSYEVPEIIAIPVIHGYDKYLEWLTSELKM
ncbi:MAG: divalent-cation tolerance protein CutA [Thaumarchaeota archaeon]|jgi:periplasmic divalent cation tolerance protein|nr:divalent-cation tolerance protein CutA [Candidatus Geocrenenecus arthurdayi]